MPLFARVIALPPLGRTVVLVGLTVLGCSSTTEGPTGDLAVDLLHRDPRIRVRATKTAVEQNRRDLVPALLDNLSERDGAVRWFSAIALRKLSGQTFGFEASESPAQRRAAIERWRTWARAEGLLEVAAATDDSEEEKPHD